ncbi:hypothetical protein niasHS_007524 [Heterodera schachtii]|uniref:Lipocalin domain-containing protein n=1 Tax=Heterodera schachtii TaxID=97005 RepID=A0ABD2JY22_HETSC
MVLCWLMSDLVDDPREPCHRSTSVFVSLDELAVSGVEYFHEHLHNDDEIRYIRAGEGYFDVRSKALISGSVLPSFAFVNASASADPLNATSAFGLPFPPSVSLPPVLAALFPDLNTSTPITLTAAHQEDVNIHVLFNGPLNERGQYEFTVVSNNRNYPVYVFARDPVRYKQRYEMAVQQLLEHKGVVNGIRGALVFAAGASKSAEVLHGRCASEDKMRVAMRDNGSAIICSICLCPIYNDESVFF